MGPTNDALRSLAARFAQFPQVVAVALGGSAAAGVADDQSDVDVYVFTRGSLTSDARKTALAGFAAEVENVDYWGPSTVGRDLSGEVDYDVTFFEAAWIESHFESVLVRNEPQLGYTTAFINTVHQCQILSDMDEWLEQLQGQTRRPYPQRLASNILDANLRAMRSAPHSYRDQLAVAVRRGDRVSMNHRLAAVLASYFDVVFAMNLVYHPGEKRLVAEAHARCRVLPEAFHEALAAVLPGGADLVSSVDRMLDELERTVSAARKAWP